MCNVLTCVLAYYAYGKESYLDTIGEYMEIHATFSSDPKKIPNHIVNHGECVIVYVTITPSPIMITYRYTFSAGFKIVRDSALLVCHLYCCSLLVYCSHQSCSLE